jgi:hypothetical protein
MADALLHARSQLEEARTRVAATDNARCGDVSFAVGDLVHLSTANLALPSTMSRKLTARFKGFPDHRAGPVRSLPVDESGDQWESDHLRRRSV